MFLDEKKLVITMPEGLSKGEVTVEDGVVKFTATPSQDGDFEIQATYNDGEPIKIPLKVATPVFGTGEFTTEQSEFHLEDEMAIVVQFSKKLPKLEDLKVTCSTPEAVQSNGEPETHEDSESDAYTVTYKFIAKQLGEDLNFNIVYKEGEPTVVPFKITAEPTLQAGSAKPAEIENDETSEVSIPFSIA